jgi:hypothetical protein
MTDAALTRVIDATETILRLMSPASLAAIHYRVKLAELMAELEQRRLRARLREHPAIDWTA